jgi:hypothetical protein
MSDAHNRPPAEKEPGAEALKIHAQDSAHVIDAKGPRLKLIREYIKKNPSFLILSIVLNIINCLLGLFLIGWVNVLVAAPLNFALYFVSQKASKTIREEKGG